MTWLEITLVTICLLCILGALAMIRVAYELLLSANEMMKEMLKRHGT